MARPTIHRTRPASAGAPAGPGIDVPISAPTVDTTSAADSPTPSLPHERDEKVGMTGGLQSARVRQGARDLKRGVRDTTRAPEADDAYRKLKK